MKRLLWAAAAVALATAVAVPLVAYLVVPVFVHREVHEAAPAAAPAPAASAGPSAEPAPPRTLAAGDLRRLNAVDYGSGRVLVLDTGGGRVLRFEGVDIAGAPDMYVYLSDRSDGLPGRFLDLGKLRATTGSFNYSLPAEADLGSIRSVVIWCRQFMTTVTFAPLG